jgi:hypothetical protein
MREASPRSVTSGFWYGMIFTSFPQRFTAPYREDRAKLALHRMLSPRLPRA